MSKIKKSIIYLGAFRFPIGDAAAARVLGNGKALREAGYEVVFSGWEDKSREEDMQEDGSYIYQGFRYFSQADLRHQPLSPGKRFIRYLLAGNNTLKWLSSIDLEHVEAIIAYHGNSIFLTLLRSFCKNHGIALITDCTEWYASKNLIDGAFGIANMDNEYRMRCINKHVGNIIVISSFLEKYYIKKKCSVLRIPPLVDLMESKWLELENKADEKRFLRLVYAGTSAKKDCLRDVIRGLKIVKDSGLSVELNIVGPRQKDVVDCVGEDVSLLASVNHLIKYHGRISQNEVPERISFADFSILLRPHDRYAQAGFPTKLVESLAAGVPIITNTTSDISWYVRDGIEGILLPDHSPSAFALGIKKAFALSKEQKEGMRRCARIRAEKSFDFRNYINQINQFIKKCVIS